MKKINPIDKKEDVFKRIAESSIYGNLGLFIGAGMSMSILNNSCKQIALSWKELIDKCAEEFDINIKKDIDVGGLSYPEISSNIAKEIAKIEEIDYVKAIKKLKEKIAELTCWYPEENERKNYGEIIENINPNWIITTNYDLIIECILTGKCMSLGPDDQLISSQGLIPIYHLHGIRTNPDSIIISQEDYISLFRPNQYRQQKLPLLIKESTTLIIGYGLSDVNVLTAVDWAKNVYSGQRVNYPQDIIQLFYTDSPKDKPYRDKNDILIIEFDDLKTILNDITVIIKQETEKQETENDNLQEINNIFKNPSKEKVIEFITNEQFRKEIIDAISENGIKLISGFLELFSKAIDKTWERAKPNGAFFAYNENLIILLDIIENIKLSNIPPALFESIAYNLNNVSPYIGNKYGESREAYKTWENRKNKIPDETRSELNNIAKSRDYYGLKKLLKTIKKEHYQLNSD